MITWVDLNISPYNHDCEELAEILVLSRIGKINNQNEKAYRKVYKNLRLESSRFQAWWWTTPCPLY